MIALAVFASTALGAFVLTAGVRHYALARGVIDRPNDRSLHTAPVPRGGGIAIVLVAASVHAMLVFGGTREPGLAAWWWGSLAMAGLGFWDDHRPLGARVRLCAQLITAFACVLATPWPPLALPLELLRAVVLAVAATWAVNLYNFMDGADGIAGTQAVTGALALAGAFSLGGDSTLAILAAALAGASLGFTWWNWQPARIFMGDAGSYYLGWQFAALGIGGAARGAAPWPFLIVLAPFITDATATLLRRVLRGEAWFQAHRSHAYQLLIRGGWPHRRVALALALLCVAVLWPLAWLAASRPGAAPAATLIAYALAATIWGAILLRERALLHE